MSNNKLTLRSFGNNLYESASDNLYKSFNEFIFSDNITVLGKLLKRFEFFLQVKNLPGDIVELGVFKGSGVATFAKFLQIYCPNSIKKIIGFDLFDGTNDVIDKYEHGNAMDIVYDRVDRNTLSYESVKNNLSNIRNDLYELVTGDICVTTKEYSELNPGLRISLLYIDTDLAEPSYHGLKNLWKHIIPNGVILFDEYQYHKFDESNGVDKFLKEHNIEYEILSTNWVGPDCFLIKKK